MQIHELNNFTGTLGSGAYLAVDDGTDTGKLSTQQLLAATEARIDNIIAGPAPSAEEIVDARLGDDGVTYPSLGDAIRDQVGDLKSEISEITNTTPYINMEMEQGGISSDGSLVSSDILIRTKTAFACSPSESITLTDASFEYRIFGLYQGNMQIIKDYDQGNTFTFSVDKQGVKIVLRRTNRANLSPSDVDLNSIFTTTISAIIGYDVELEENKVVPIIEDYLESKINYMNLKEVGYDFENMMWSWWCYPQVISKNYVRNQAYFGFTTNDGCSGVAQYNFDTGERKKTILKKSDVDDHNAPAVFLSNAGKVVVAYSGGHNTDKKMHIRISKSIENIDLFEDVIDIDCGDWTTYAQMIYSTGYYYLFFRLDNVAWCYTKSTNLRDWSVPQKIIDAVNIQYYVRFVPTDNDSIIRMVMYSNPSEGHTEIRQGFLNTYTHKVKNSDNSTELGNDTTAYAYTDFDVIIPVTTGKENRLFDVAITPPSHTSIAYCTFTTSVPDDSEYYVYRDGASAKVVDGGNSFWFPKYQGGVSFITSDKIILSRSNDGKDKVEIYEYSSGTWSKTKSVYEATNYATSSYPIRNVRPIVDVNGRIAFWHSGYYNSGDFTLFDSDARFEILE